MAFSIQQMGAALLLFFCVSAWTVHLSSAPPEKIRAFSAVSVDRGFAAPMPESDRGRRWKRKPSQGARRLVPYGRTVLLAADPAARPHRNENASIAKHDTLVAKPILPAGLVQTIQPQWHKCILDRVMLPSVDVRLEPKLREQPQGGELVESPWRAQQGIQRCVPDQMDRVRDLQRGKIIPDRVPHDNFICDDPLHLRPDLSERRLGFLGKADAINASDRRAEIHNVPLDLDPNIKQDLAIPISRP